MAEMSLQYTIGQLAKEANVPTSTVRYYERRQLLHPVSRSGGNYRMYDSKTLERLLFIRSAQNAGFTLKDIESLLRFRDGDGDPCAEVQALITARLEQVHQEREHLELVDGLLEEWLRVCTTICKEGKCGVLSGLSNPETKN